MKHRSDAKLAGRSANHPPRVMIAWLAWGLVFVVVAIASLAGAFLPPSSTVMAEAPILLDPSRVVWSHLSYKGSKFLLHANSDVELTPVATAKAALIESDQGSGLEPRSESLLLLTLRSKILRQESFLRLWFEPADAAALQRIQLETSKKRSRHRTYRFLRNGVFAIGTAPADGEEGLPHDRWTNVTESVHPYPDEIGASPLVTEPSALLYMASAAALSGPGDKLAIHAFSRRKLHRVAMAVEEVTRLKVDYVEASAKGERRVKGRVEALRLSLRAESLGEADEDFRLLGLRGDIALFLDKRTRLPLEVAGKLGAVGRVHVKLQRAVLGSHP